MEIEYVRSRFIKHFDGLTGAIYTLPGRVNLIGEHTDYNGGFVFPGAVDKGIMAEIRPNGTNKVKAYSIDLKDYVEFGLNEEDAPRTSWARYSWHARPPLTTAWNLTSTMIFWKESTLICWGKNSFSIMFLKQHDKRMKPF